MISERSAVHVLVLLPEVILHRCAQTRTEDEDDLFP